MRDADILRSYIAQSLFYLIPDACLMFTPPAVTVGARRSLNNGDLPPVASLGVSKGGGGGGLIKQKGAKGEWL